MKILIVDDSSTMRRIIINTLSRIGYTDVVEGEHGKAGLEKLGQESHIEIIKTTGVTTNAAKEDIVQALQAGVNNYVVKPFTPDTLKEKIESLLG